MGLRRAQFRLWVILFCFLLSFLGISFSRDLCLALLDGNYFMKKTNLWSAVIFRQGIG